MRRRLQCRPQAVPTLPVRPSEMTVDTLGSGEASEVRAPLLLLTLVALAAGVALVWSAPPAAADALRGEVHERRGAGRGGRRKRVAALRPTGPLHRFARLVVRAFARPHVDRLTPKEKAMVILVIDSSRSMQARTWSRRGSPPRRKPRAVPRSRPGQAARRAGRLRRRGAGCRAADDRPRRRRAVARRARRVSDLRRDGDR